MCSFAPSPSYLVAIGDRLLRNLYEFYCEAFWEPIGSREVAGTPGTDALANTGMSYSVGFWTPLLLKSLLWHVSGNTSTCYQEMLNMEATRVGRWQQYLSGDWKGTIISWLSIWGPGPQPIPPRRILLERSPADDWTPPDLRLASLDPVWWLHADWPVQTKVLLDRGKTGNSIWTVRTRYGMDFCEMSLDGMENIFVTSISRC